MDNSIYINAKNNQSDTTIASQNDTKQNQSQKRKEIEDILNLNNTQEKSIRSENDDKPSISIHINTQDFDKRSATTTIVDNKNSNYWSKYLILTLISVGSMLMPISCTITYSAAEEIRAEFDVNDMINGLPFACFLISFGIFPLIWASYSDKHQTRKQVYVAGLVILIIASIICAISKNIWVYIVMRALQACGVAVVICIGGGIICDIFSDHERGQAYGIFSFGRETGGLIGPVIGGLITSSLGWRFNFWFITILSGIFMLLTIFFLPETFPQPLSKFLPNITFSSTVDAYPEKSASAIAVSDCLCYIISGIIIVFVSSEKDTLNHLTLFSSMAGVSALSGLILIIVEIKGESWRNRYN
ncbi:MFS general substrate transporter [Rhizophagus irregularis]|uniref:MFS general substrate transporter n=1 Tax=Rhizophagus irregularis TaxID=588596 RepID=A0A2I1GP64_9GLOM|nr:MFS general substrate transporter [Rhizophagus irregularis]